MIDAHFREALALMFAGREFCHLVCRKNVYWCTCTVILKTIRGGNHSKRNIWFFPIVLNKLCLFSWSSCGVVCRKGTLPLSVLKECVLMHLHCNFKDNTWRQLFEKKFMILSYTPKWMMSIFEKLVRCCLQEGNFVIWCAERMCLDALAL